ncbi:50S ribosomal protein L3 [Candidatus Woesebacteria bacterium]|nr:50S ribosomal protein L3 [Candidatus Woesebacteria bacterium]
MDTILGTKKKMSQTFVGETRIPVTLVQAGPCVVTSIKDKDRDGYWAVQIAYGQKKLKNINKPLMGHLKGAIEKSKIIDQKSKVAPSFIREVRLEEKPELKVGDIVKISDIFTPGDVVQVTGIGKGKGFQGVVKRWGFATSGRSHGEHRRRRAPGSIGQGTDPGRVHKGKKMPGRMGGSKITIKNLKIVKVDEENNLLMISGSIPGSVNSFIVIAKTAEGKRSDLEKEVEVAPEKGTDAPNEETENTETQKQE